VCADGSRLSVLVNATADLDESGQPVVVRIALFDATERRQYERELLGAKVRAEQSERRARELARTLQQALLPPRTPEIPGLRVGHVFRAAGEGAEVGGDFYDTFQLGEDDWVVVIGDVCGKGVEAAVVTMLVRHTLRAVTVGLHAPSEALDALNDVLLRHDTERFCTVAMVRLRRDGAGWNATISAGGHPPPLLCRADGEILSCGGHGPLLGVVEDATFSDETVHLGPGDGLVLYTDGVTEARNGHELFGEATVRAVLAQAPSSPAERVGALLAEVESFSGGAPRDDVAIVALQVQ
jgi:sigma-B regulation protein RsbU (phosphoserine phosphatase)